MQPQSPLAPPKKPSALGLWIGAVIIVLGIVLGAGLVVKGVVDMTNTIDDYQRVSSRAGGTVELGEGSYTIFYERPEETGDLTFSISPSLEVYDPSGQRVPLRYPSGSETYDVGDRHGRRLAKIDAPVAGTYELRSGGFRTDGGAERGFGEFAIGRESPFSAAGPAIIGGVLGGLAVIGVGIVVMIVSGVRRGRARRAVAFAGAPTGGWAPPPAGGGWAASPTSWGGGPAGSWPPAPGPPPPADPPGWVPPATPPPSAPPPPGAGGDAWPPSS